MLLLGPMKTYRHQLPHTPSSQKFWCLICLYVLQLECGPACRAPKHGSNSCYQIEVRNNCIFTMSAGCNFWHESINTIQVPREKLCNIWHMKDILTSNAWCPFSEQKGQWKNIWAITSTSFWQDSGLFKKSFVRNVFISFLIVGWNMKNIGYKESKRLTTPLSF